MTKRIFLAAISVCVLCALSWTARAEDYVAFQYVGQVRVGGLLFDGTGQFKFAIVDLSGSHTLWSNDMTSVDGGEPDDSVAIEVVDGVFNVAVGDPDLGMEPINSVVFNQPNRIKLRIWFNDGEHGFQQLLPDRRIINPELLGLFSTKADFTIYVDGLDGNDENNGLTTDTAKRTIQSAVDVLPGRIDSNVTIKIADGIYREQVTLFGTAVFPEKKLTFLGDPDWTPDDLPTTPSVRITGVDADGADSVRDFAFRAQQCTGIACKGILFDHAADSGAYVSHGDYEFYNCLGMHNTQNGFAFINNTRAVYRNCTANYNGTGYRSRRNCAGYFENVAARYNSADGFNLNTQTLGEFKEGLIASDNGNDGFHITHNSNLWFSNGFYGGLIDGEIHDNGRYGIFMGWDSYSENHTWVSIENNDTTNVYLQAGSQTY